MLTGDVMAFMMDEISTGLDSAATFDIMQMLKKFAHHMRHVYVVALLQPPPEVYALFDDVIVMDNGSIVYHGPTQKVLPYFQSIGYRCPPRKDVADFLQEVTTEDGEDFLMSREELQEYREQVGLTAKVLPGGGGGEDFKVPRNTMEFVAAFQETNLHKDILAGMSDYNPVKSKFADWDAQSKEHVTREFAVSWFEALKANVSRSVKLLRRDIIFVKSRILQCTVIGLILGSLFWQRPEDAITEKMGCLFFVLMVLGTAGLAQIPSAFAKRGVFYKHRANGFYQTSAYVLSDTVVALPLSMLEGLILGSLIYFMVGLAPGAQCYLTFVFQLLCLQICLMQWFKFLAALCPVINVAQPLGGVSLMMMVLFSGFVANINFIPFWWTWLYYINPLTWCLQALAQNEFLSGGYYDRVVAEVIQTDGNPYLGVICTPLVDVQTATVGECFLGFYGYETDPVYISLGAMVVLLEYVVFVGITIFCLEYRQHKGGQTGGKVKKTEEDRRKERESLKQLTRKGSKSSTRYEAVGEGHGSSSIEVRGTSSAIPFEPVTICWRNLWYTVELKDQKDTGGNIPTLDLLKGVSGFAKPERLTALMGASGAGKTTLMDVIAGRKTSGTINGDILVNGYKQDLQTFGRISGYVEQMDIHSPMTTVAEAVSFAGRLRLPESIPMAMKDAFIKDVLDMLELDEIKGRIVGTLQEGGLSVEQRKRLTIAVELSANPSVLFLDEPTSGLDARAAIIVMQSIRKISSTGRSVMCTIHQPSSFLFEMFDDLLLLKRGGETVFFGEIGDKSETLINYFSGYPGVKPINDGYNPATWMLEVIGAGTGINTTGKQLDFAELYRNSALMSVNEDEVERLCVVADQDDPDYVKKIEFTQTYATSSRTQFVELIRKYRNVYYRTPSYTLSKLSTAAFIAGIFGSVFYDVEIESTSDLQAKLAMIFITAQFACITSLASVIPVMSAERAAFYRERAARTYSVETYAMATGMVEVPYLILASGIFINIFYWSTGLNVDFSAYLQYWLTYFLYTSMATFAGQFVVALLPTPETAQVVGTAFLSISGMFSGFLIPYKNIPAYWQFMYWITPPHYVLESFSTSQFHNDQSCVAYGPAGGCVTTVQDVMEGQFSDFSYSFSKYDILVLTSFIVLFRIGCYLSLKYISHLAR
jgi:ABC-type multidrug transport system ATPase subunit/ABC-type multidrug transport system permease subunit